MATAMVFLLLSGCEEVVQNANLPYTEVLVIRGILQDGGVVDSLSVERTLPYEERSSSYWDEEKQTYVYPTLERQVTNAAVTITVNGIPYPLTHRGHGFYGNDTLVCRVGMSYTLHVEWNGKKADARTTIPATPVVDSVSFRITPSTDHLRSDEKHIVCTGYLRCPSDVALFLNASYWWDSFYVLHGDTIFTTDAADFGRTIIQRAASDPGRLDSVTVEGNEYLEERGTRHGWITVDMTAYDVPFYRYYMSAYRSDNYASPLDAVPVAWNVTGDAIGMFIGRSGTVSRKIVLK